ncbi:CinA family protein [Planctomicrobium sp. SH661]|uniref:CinA family protein n=1 Tax=Planctomicrobium sp. SH661 TaxID=3448124 RepID=UPI003F5C25E9
MSDLEKQLFALAHQLGTELKSRRVRLILAESCTGGVVSMALTDVPGISDVYCGSAVTYRNETKAEWLGVSRRDLADSRIGAVSAQVAEQMCLGALQRTPEAELAASITGHLGPNAPAELDGVVYIGVAFRSRPAWVQRRTLTVSEASAEHSLRHLRQREAGTLVLQAVLSALSNHS